MSVTDPIADYLIRIRNAISAGHEKVDIPSSRVKVEITKILKEEGFIANYKVQEDAVQGSIRIFLKYADGASVITGLKQVSRPGCRIYAVSEKVPKVMGGLGVAIVSTSKGIMTGHETHKQGVGGEVLCEIW
ncbi:30S ribosomal protein S8 [bacterium]|nr:30S ribosomal protein S8 [bacterium]MCI0606049.1 30S ribosomal protein S8 [bacterium]